ncbi:MAG: rRNA maturation RNase YbeY [Candidatus Dormibacterales bacterium]
MIPPGGGPTGLEVEVSGPRRGAAPGAPDDAFVAAVLSAAREVPEIAARMPVGEAEVAVRVTDDDELRRLNHAFLGEDRPTDVLSFPAGEGQPGDARHLGDIAVSWPAVLRQAEEFGHPPPSELALLLVHGLLHLLGWDHAALAEEAEMSRLTLSALAAAGVAVSPGRV